MAKQDLDSIVGRLLIAQSKIVDIPESGHQEARQAAVRGIEGALSLLLVYAKGNDDQRALLSRAEIVSAIPGRHLNC